MTITVSDAIRAASRTRRSQTRTQEPTEAQIQGAVLAHWRQFGVPGSLVAAIPNQKAFGQAGLTQGLFDLLCIAPGFGVGFLELKTLRGRLSSHQIRFREVLMEAGVRHAVAWGRDEPIQVLKFWGIVR